MRSLVDGSPNTVSGRQRSLEALGSSWTSVRWKPSDLAQYLQDADCGALAKNEGSADKCDGPPKREEDSEVNDSRNIKH